MRHRKRRKIGGKSILGAVVFAAVLILLGLAAAKADKAIRPMAQKQSEHAARAAAARIIAETAADCLNGYTYSDLAAVLYDESGRPAAVEALTGNINRIQADLTAALNTRLTDTQASAGISAGSLSGSTLLAGRGPQIKVRICPAGAADVALKSTFDSAGINQTRHRIYAEISVDLTSSLPMYTFSSRETFDLLLAETVIVGEVPDYALRTFSTSFS